MKPSLDWLLVFVPVTVGLHFLAPDRQTLIFICACLAILPLAGWLGRATEQIAEKTDDSIGGLMNATFGNAAELIIAFAALRKGLHEVVKASLTGSIIGNLLLVLGLSIFAGGLRHKVQRFNASGAQTQSTMLLLAAAALVCPAMFHFLAGPAGIPRENDLSLEIAVVLLLSYFAGLWFSLRTHKDFFHSGTKEVSGKLPHAGWSLRKSVAVLTGATVLIAWMSEILVGAVEHAAGAFGMTSVFVGLIVVAIVGNAAEHSTAIFMARENRMDLSLGIALGSSLQIALFVAPLLVLVSFVVGPRPMNLVFTPMEVIAVVVAVLLTVQITNDGESNWYEGVQLLALYIILGIIIYFLPEVAEKVSSPSH